jgi:hypothetical protein
MKKLYIAVALLSLLGLADALYLTIEHVTGQSVKCTITSGCSEVLSSPYAVVAGFPLAAIGAAAYFTVFSLATLAAFGYRAAGTLLTPLISAMFLPVLPAFRRDHDYVAGHHRRWSICSQARIRVRYSIQIRLRRWRDGSAATNGRGHFSPGGVVATRAF